MSERGASVIEAQKFLRSYYEDIAKLLVAVDANLTVELVRPRGTSVTNNTSSDQAPRRWLPHTVARLYLQAPDGGDASYQADWFAFFAIHFSPRLVKEPVALWGTGVMSQRQNVWTPFSRFVLPESGPEFLTWQPVKEWLAVENAGKEFKQFQYRATAVDELVDETAVKCEITDPLLELYKRQRLG